MTTQGGQFMKKTTLAILAGLMVIVGNAHAASFPTVGAIDTEVTVTENLQFSVTIDEGKADGSCCAETFPSDIAFTLTDVGNGILGARPMYTFINVASNSQAYTVKYTATSLNDGSGDLDDTIVFTKLISAVNNGNDIQGISGSTAMTTRQLPTNGGDVTIFSQADGKGALIQLVTAINNYDGTDAVPGSGLADGKAFPSGNIPDGNTPAGTYAGTVTYSAVLGV